MKLISIKAHGFKSFADKIEISVDDKITGIVGPNGSGKSNVVDAIRWVLGESSLKEIRGGEKLADCIFNGSSSRGACSRAWVSLTFDNTDHYLASDYNEIEIKREVYKTGENEYYINNTKVRKKDITDLFLDSGTNANSFSIISQGRISEILKGKPSDRRAIIEEAASVLKYKKRKEETSKKLVSTMDNLDKVTLVINELEGNVEPLRKQAEDAKKYLDLKSELEGIEISLIASDIKTINDQYKSDKERLTSLNEEILTMDNKQTSETTKIESLKLSSIKIDEEISSLTDELIRINETLSSLETKKQVMSERRKYEVDDQLLESNILILKERIVELKKNISVIDSEVTSIEKEIGELTTKVDNVNTELKNERLRKTTLISELDKKSRELVNVRSKIDVLNDQIENDTKLPFAVKSVINNPRLNGIHDVLSKLIDVKEEHVKAIEVALGANQNVIVVDKDENAKEAINYLKENKLGRATFFPISVIKPRGVDVDSLKVAESLAGFVGVASNLVTYNPLYSGVVENQLGNVLVVNNMDIMNKLGKLTSYHYRVITLDGEILHSGGSITGGSVKNNTSGSMNIRYELEKLINEENILVNEIKLIEEHINEIDLHLNLLEESIRNSIADLSGKKEILNQKQISRKELINDLEKNENELNGTKNVLDDSVDNELDNIMNEILSVSTKKEINTRILSEKKTTRNELSNELNELESINRKATSAYNQKLNEIKNLEVNIGKMDIKLDNLLTRLASEYNLTYEKAHQEYTLEMDEEVARSKVNHLKRDIRDLGDVNVGAIEEFDRVNTRYTFLKNQSEDLLGAINDLNEIIEDLDSTMEEKFMSTFNEVNHEFGRVFNQLFKGGNAELVLTEPENVLETGVEINAYPPGKSIKSINALSGGEMTLTAIALLFSILNIRTVPFCILDEVEAALDEANVDTFGTYLKNYGDVTQFIVITHKKKTMEYADTLYGITMQESGVSKLVSVKLADV